MAYGYTQSAWDALTEDEQIDMLAHQHVRRQFLDNLLDGFRERIAAGKAIEHSAYVLALIERYAR